MAKRTKQYQQKARQVDTGKIYKLSRALSLVSKVSYGNFKPALELHLDLKLPKDTDPKSVKIPLVLPHTVGVDVRVAVLTDPQNKEKALAAGAAAADLEQLSTEIAQGNVEYDLFIATPEVMGEVAKLGRFLGPKGLMPNPRNGTVVDIGKVGEVIAEFQKGKMIVKADQAGGVHLKVGELSFTSEQLQENVLEAVKKIAQELRKPVENLVQKAYLAPTMGKSLKIDIKSLQ